MMSKDFSAENPFSQFAVALFRTTDRVFQTRVRQTRFGFWEETIVKEFEGGERDELRLQLPRFAYELGVNWESDNLQVLAISSKLRAHVLESAIKEDLTYVVLVVLACLAYMALHLGSLFLATASLLNIFMSIPLSLVAYTYIIRVTYFSTLHLAIVFIALGIGCDDVFVFHDFWVGTLKIKALEKQPILRISLAWRRAAGAMLVTSLTSMISFASCTISEIIPIASFGWFATLVVPAVYF